MYGAMEESPPSAAPALGPEELKAVRKLLSTTSSTNGGYCRRRLLRWLRLWGLCARIYLRRSDRYR